MTQATENPWKSNSSEIKYDNPWISIREHQIINPSGKDGIYGVVEFKHVAVAVVPLDDDYNTWIVGQHRFPLDTYEWEVPEGGSPPTESTLETAKRELLEEAGLLAEEYLLLMEMQLSNSTTNEVSVTYIARGITVATPDPDEDESIEIRKISFAALYEMALNGEIRDALSVASILKVKAWIDMGKL